MSRPGKILMLGSKRDHSLLWGNFRQCWIQTSDSADCLNSEVFVHVGLSIENSVGEFFVVPNNGVLSVIWLRVDKSSFSLGVNNHDYDSQFNDSQFNFCFTPVSCDIQIRQLINDIKCTCALADMCTLKPWCNMQSSISVKATSYFSPALH